MIPIAKRLLEEHADVIFSTYREGVNYVEREKFPLIKAPPIGFQVKPGGSVDFRQTAINPGPFFASFTLLKQINSEVETIERFKPNVIVSDSRISPLVAARILRIPPNLHSKPVSNDSAEAKALLAFGKTSRLSCPHNCWQDVGERKHRFDTRLSATIHNMRGQPDHPEILQKKCEANRTDTAGASGRTADEGKASRKTKVARGQIRFFVPISGPTTEKAFVMGVLRRMLLDFPQDYGIVMALGYPNADNKPIHARAN